MPASTARPPVVWLALLVLPVVWWVQAGDAVLGFASEDLEGHLWTLWNASRGPMTRSSLVNAPTGVDLMPIVGGWLDIRLGSWLSHGLGVARAYNAVLAVYALLAGLGGMALARALGASVGAATVAGLLLQLDPFVLLHLGGGRPEQAGLGLVALALAGAVGAWRTAERKWVVLAGVAGALVLFASWELGILLAVGMVLALPVLALGLPAAPGVGRRWASAAALTTALAGPWVVWFLVRSMAVRASGHDPIGLEIAQHSSIGWLQFWLPTGGNPGLVPTLTLLALPVLDTSRRRLWLGVWGVLVLAFVLGLGPVPAASPGGAPLGMPGLFGVLQHVPVLRWFHWPDRVVSVWGVLGAGATGFAVSELARGGRRKLAGMVAALAVLVGLLRVQQAALWPQARFELPQSALWEALRTDPTEGALFDLPVRMRGIPSYAPALAQIQHHRPVRSYGGVPWLLPPPEEHAPLPPFSTDLDPRRPVPTLTIPDVDLDLLRDQGFAFIVLQRPRGAAAWWAAAEAELSRTLGRAELRDDTKGWVVWRL